MPVVCGEETLGADPGMGGFATGAPVYPGEDDATAREFLPVIERTLSREAKLSERSKANKSIAVSQNSWQHAADQYIEIISRLVPRTVLNSMKPEVAEESECL
jgi:hypothetical protein